jgi:ABC-2 type transport system ATP-binding protein
MKQKLALSCALIHTPDLLMLDEPTTGVDPVSRREFWAILNDLRGQGITIVVSTPYMDEAEFCDDLALLHRGRIIAAGAPSALLTQYPLHLYEVTGDGGALAVPAGAALPESVALAYPAGGSLRIATPLPPDDSSRLFEDVKRLVPAARSMTPVNATAEDLFFYHLSSASGAGETPAPAPRKKGRH